MLGGNPFGDAGVRAIADSATGLLEVLDLTYCEVGDAGAAALASSDSLGELWRLGLAENRIGDPGLAALAASQRSLPKLGWLDVGENTFGPAGIRALADCPWLERLDQPWLRGIPTCYEAPGEDAPLVSEARESPRGWGTGS